MLFRSPTGIDEIDSKLTGGGFEKGMMNVIMAEPGCGKTSLALDITGNAASAGKVVVFFTLELSREVLIDRLVSPYAKLERYKISPTWLNSADFSKLVAVSEAFKSANLFIDDSSFTLAEMRNSCRTIARETGGVIDLIVLDFLQNMNGDGKTLYEKTSMNSRGFAQICKEFNAAGVALSQISNDAQKREGDPKLSDARDSGAIGEVGRTIIALYDADEAKPYRNVRYKCLKQGEGAQFKGDLIFDTELMTFGGRMVG